MPNRLIESSSPYLLQHAHNPVNWYPWGEEALALARQANRPIIVSIGYSACHWCHVMERESFENEAIAELMNREFVCIKVDREERPDIDQIYMEAVQLMGLNGGWPLNVILAPAGDPFYGGTYFRPEQWAQMLGQVAEAYRNHQDELEKSALSFRESLNRSELRRFGLMQAQDSQFHGDRVRALVDQLSGKFDRQKGGMKGAPKFPMPCIYQFLLNAHATTQHPDALAHTLFTLEKIAYGGIYDQLGGGFARYSVDDRWFAPHFEKMLYDNAQLLPLYAQAFALTGNARFREVAEETVAFVRCELTSPEGGFYSALDADSEGVEGKFYTWNVQEIKELLGIEADWFLEFYGCEMGGNWEHTNILYRSRSVEEFAEANGMAPEWLHAKLAEWKATLMTARAARIRPGLDDKVLASWNGLMISGLAEAGVLLGNVEMIELAQQNARFVWEKMSDGAQLWHTYKDSKASIPGYLEDYAAVIQGLIALYQADFDERWLQKAHDCCEYALSYFFDEEEGMFFFTDEQSEKLIARKKEVFDNVIPASNSIMAHNLHRLGILFDRPSYRDLAADMTARMANLFDREVRYLTNWASLYALLTKEMAEVVIIGPEAKAWAAEMGKVFSPNRILMATVESSPLPLMQYREAIGGQTTIYVCYNNTCQMPVHSIAEALKKMQDAGQKI